MKSNLKLLFSIMILKNRNNIYYIIILLLFVLIPANRFFPNASQVVGAFRQLVDEYSLATNLLYSLSVIIISLLGAYLISALLIPSMKRRAKENFSIGKMLKRFGQLAPPFLFGVYLILLFPGSPIINIVFGIVTATALQLMFAAKAVSTIPEHFMETVNTFDNDKQKATRAFLKSLAPLISFSFMKKLNGIVWIYLIIFEFVKNSGSGAGTVVRLAYEYWDIPMLFAASISITIIIFITDATITLIAKRLFVMESGELFK